MVGLEMEVSTTGGLGWLLLLLLLFDSEVDVVVVISPVVKVEASDEFCLVGSSWCSWSWGCRSRSFMVPEGA